MEDAVCSFPGCGGKRAHLPTGLCKPHRRMQLRGEGLRPLRHWTRRSSETCTGPECFRPVESHDLCKQHATQLRKTGTLHVIGDSTYRAERARERWAALDQTARDEWVRKMQAGLPRTRSESHIRALAAANRASWARKRAEGAPGERVCLLCGTTYVPEDWRQFYCTREHRNLAARIRRRGITYEAYETLRVQQCDSCALCGRRWYGWGGRTGLHIDHDHRTGKPRGLLCGDCNTAIGRFGDDPALLRRAAEYLERFMS